MAWTTPRDWTTGEIVTETMMDTHVKDNLRYLKGMDGAVTLDNELIVEEGQTRIITLDNLGTDVHAFLGLSSTNGAVWDINRDPTTGTFGDTAKSHARVLMSGDAAASFITLNTASAANTLATEKLRIAGDGNVGIGVSSPQSILHIHGGDGGFMHYENSATFSSPVTIIPNATGDVLYRLYFIGVARCTNGPASTAVTGVSLTPGGGAGNIASLNAAADVIQMTVAADGSVTITRTAGSSTWTLSLFLMWA